MRLILMIITLGVGFGVGVYWGVHHPVEAAKLSDEEERRFLEAQVKISEQVKQKLDRMATKPSSPPTGGFVSGFTGSPGNADPDVASLRDQEDQQLQQLRQRLNQIKK